MPTAKAQFKYAAMSQSPKGRKKLKAKGKKPMPVGIAKEMLQAGKGKYSKMPARARKK